MYPIKKPLSVVDLTQELEQVIGTLRIQTRACALSVANKEVRVEPRQMQVLVALANAAPDVVTRADLSAKAWGSSIVGEDALNRCITRLRRALLELGQPAQIETVPKVGYRLVPSHAGQNAQNDTDVAQAASLDVNAPLGAELDPLGAVQCADEHVAPAPALAFAPMGDAPKPAAKRARRFSWQAVWVVAAAFATWTWILPRGPSLPAISVVQIRCPS
jgi:DNA-binding winged helix-turn-helix (wHTH) protein